MCCINNDVQHLTNTTNQLSIQTKPNHIECIQLEDSDDEHSRTPRKRAKLSDSPQPSLPSLPPQPQPSHSNNINGSERSDVHNGECKLTDTNNAAEHAIHENKPKLTDKMSKSEQLIKRLISICVEKRFEAQIQRLNTEQNWIKRVKILKTESANRNIELKLIKRANKQKTPTVFRDIGIQANFSENKQNDNNNMNGTGINDVNDVKGFSDGSECYNEFVKIEQNNGESVPSISDSKTCPILEKRLSMKEINASEVLKQNGLIKTESNENIEPKNETKTTSKVEDNTNLGEDNDIITIDSDDDCDNENVVNDEHLKADFSLKISVLSDSLPVPKLSVSYSKQINNKYNLNDKLKSVTLKWTLSQADKQTHKNIIEKYLIYMYRDPKTENSHPIGCVDALDPPMACTLSNLSKGIYHFYVRAFDCDRQMGPSSNVEQIEIF